MTTTPGQLVDAAVASATERFTQRGVALTTDVAPQLPSLTVDPDRIGQVLGNLLDNALRHTPSGGQVHVRASAAAGEVTLEVADTGPGIPSEHLPHVFERFYRADTARDRASGGSGIGLAICKALTEAHGGTITATSTAAGATFVATLPTSSAAHAALVRDSSP